MHTNQNSVLAVANRIIQQLLLNTNVESFGVLHQIPFIDFRNEHGDDMHLTFDSGIVFHPQCQIQFSKAEQMLVGTNSINLKRVVKVGCTNASDLEIHFEDGSWFRICGTSEDGYEPWQVSNGYDIAAGGILLIAHSEGGYSFWEGPSNY